MQGHSQAIFKRFFACGFPVCRNTRARCGSNGRLPLTSARPPAAPQRTKQFINKAANNSPLKFCARNRTKSGPLAVSGKKCSTWNIHSPGEKPLAEAAECLRRPSLPRANKPNAPSKYGIVSKIKTKRECSTWNIPSFFCTGIQKTVSVYIVRLKIRPFCPFVP